MSYSVRQPNIFGRLGTEVGKGLAEQIPKEVAQSRLASGLAQLERDSDKLSPQQYFTRAASIPGVLEHPQLVQSLEKLAQTQRAKNFYQGKTGNPSQGQGQGNQSKRSDLENVNFLNQQGNTQKQPSEFQPGQKTNEPGKKTTENPYAEARNIPSDPILERNPLSPELTPKKPWDQDRWLDEMGRASEERPDLDEAGLERYVANKQQREQEQPLAEQAIDERLKQIDADTDNAYDKRYRQVSQKDVADGDALPGEIHDNLRRRMKQELKYSPKMNLDSAVKKWTDIANDLTKDTNKLNSIGKEFFPDSLEKRYNEIRKGFKKYGELEGFAKMLSSYPNKLTPFMGYHIAYKNEDNPTINNIIKGSSDLKDAYTKQAHEKNIEKTKNMVDRIVKNWNKNLSPLSIAYDLHKKGYDTQVVLDRIAELNDGENGHFLNEVQGRQMQEARRYNPSLDDTYLELQNRFGGGR